MKVFRKDSETQRAAELSDEAKTRWKASCCLMIRMLCCRWFSCIDEFEEQSGPSHTKKTGATTTGLSDFRNFHYQMGDAATEVSRECWKKNLFLLLSATSFYLCFISRFIFLSLSVSSTKKLDKIFLLTLNLSLQGRKKSISQALLRWTMLSI